MIPYLIATLSVVVIFTLAGLALNLQWGMGGLVNFGLFGFYMLGAYICGLLVVRWGLNPLVAMTLAILTTAAISALVSLISIRLSEDYLAIVTLGFAECIRLFISYEDWLTFGTLGVSGITRPFAGLVSAQWSDLAFIILAISALCVVYVVLSLVSASPFGRLMRATRDDPDIVGSLGRSVLTIRLRSFALGGAILGLAGSLHAFYYGYIDPTQFTPIITAYAFMAVVVGGRGSNPGVLLAAFVLVFVLEGSRFLVDYVPGLDGATLASLRLIAVGTALVVLLIIKPAGFGRERPTVRAGSDLKN
ncbi:branched-chain amino acid ABC transporter permease [Tianweitania populi]|uniref:Branched-chain amino acid ABC transporter permease n=1 Tax=Tianweitania populi TaxID=1607949 RepID=A0A8J3DZH2_9HYPH|nr:branched-chain amino acid ABC transporter permease [Tianweitania populi]GHD24654.1 branched-chain amino acid ABC transporter permease [Tianweitania populi]